MIAAMRPGDPAGNVRASAYFVKMVPASEVLRVLSWTPERATGVVYHVLVDGSDRYVSDITEQEIKPPDIDARATIEVIETSPQNAEELLFHVALVTGARVRSSWDAVDGATHYELFRKLGAGAYESIFVTAEITSKYEYTDGPLEDGSYTYKLVSSDDSGDSTEDEEPIALATVPLAPTDIVGSWNPTTHIFTISWTASASADINHYAIRHNGGAGPIRLDDAPEATTALTSWPIDLTGVTEDYEFLVRAVDAGGHEEQNLREMVRISVIAGVAQGFPATPQDVDVFASAGGKATVGFTYYPDNEAGEGVPGVAVEARIFWDNGTGTVDWNTPLDVLAMSNPIEPTAFSWESGALANDTYLFGVRVATAAAGGGIETDNTDEYEVTTNDDTPSATDLEVAVV